MTWAAVPTQQLKIHLVDTAGKHASFSAHLPGAGATLATAAVTNLMSAVHAASDCGTATAELTSTAVFADGAADGAAAHDRSSDKLQLVFTAADGSHPIMQIGAFAPGSTVTGTNKWNPGMADLVSLIAYVKAHCCTAEGAAIVGLARGFSRRPPRLKKP